MRKLYFWAAMLWTSAITVACLISMKNFEGITTEENADKYVHATFYLVLTVLWLLYSLKKFLAPAAKIRLLVMCATIGFGLFIEICQGLFTADRSPDLNDVFANSSGSILATLIFWIKDKIKK